MRIASRGTAARSRAAFRLFALGTLIGALAPTGSRAEPDEATFPAQLLVAQAAAADSPPPLPNPHAARASHSYAQAKAANPVRSEAANPVRPDSADPVHAERRSSRSEHRHGKAKVTGVLNVNRASEAELRLLPGIGKTRAAQIVERRSKRPYASVDEVARMRGMRKLVQRLRAHLTVKGDSTLRPLEP